MEINKNNPNELNLPKKYQIENSSKNINYIKISNDESLSERKIQAEIVREK